MIPIILHYLIFKNAGSPIDWILEKNFGKYALKFDDITDPTSVLSTEQLLILNNYPNAKSISSHQFRTFPVAEDTDFQFLSIIFIRHPIDRALSICSYMKRTPGFDYYSMKGYNSTLKQFIQFNLEPNTYLHMRNGQI